jgi:selenocysteine lyase/cysteine desulfurase
VLDPDQFRALFPALASSIHLNTAAAPPGATPVVDAVQRGLDDWHRGTFSWRAWEEEAEATRSLFGQLIGVDPETVALVPSLAEAAAAVAASLPVGRVVVGEAEFRSNLFPWMALSTRGFDVQLVPAGVDGTISTARLLEALDERTVLLAISETQSLNGYRVDVAALARAARDAGARLFVNLTQSLGALRYDAAAVDADFVAVHGYKWMLAPRGAGWLHVHPRRLGEVAPIVPSWKTADPQSELYGPPYRPAPGARRLDASLAWLSWLGAKAALELLGELNRERTEAHCLALAAHLRTRLKEAGIRTTPVELPTQIVGVEVEAPERVAGVLAKRRIVTGLRGRLIRIGFHAFNTRAEVDVTAEILAGALRAQGER